MHRVEWEASQHYSTIRRERPVNSGMVYDQFVSNLCVYSETVLWKLEMLTIVEADNYTT